MNLHRTPSCIAASLAVSTAISGIPRPRPTHRLEKRPTLAAKRMSGVAALMPEAGLAALHPTRPVGTRGALSAFQGVDQPATVTEMVKGFGCRPDGGRTYCSRGRRSKAAQARTRGGAATVYGDFSFYPSVMMVGPGRRCCRRKLGDWVLRPAGCKMGIWPDAKFRSSCHGPVRRACVGALAGTGVFRREMSASRAGSRWNAPGWCVPGRWRAGLRPSLEDLDDGHSAAAAGTRRKQIRWVWAAVAVPGEFAAPALDVGRRNIPYPRRSTN